MHSAQEVLRPGLSKSLLALNESPGFVRLGVHFTMSEAEVELIASAVDWVATHGWRLLPAYSFCTETGEWSHRLEPEAVEMPVISEHIN